MAFRDIVLMGVLMLSLAIVFMVAYMIYDQINTDLQASPIMQTEPLANESMTAVQDEAMPLLDYGIFVLFIAFFLGIVITAWFVSGNGIFTFVFFLVVGFMVGLSPIMSNIWYEYSTNPVMSPYLTTFPLSNHLLLYLPYYLAVTGLLAMFILFSKPYIFGEDGGR